MKKLFRLGMGIAVLLMALFSLWLAIIPQSAVNKADRATSRSDLYDQARYAVNREELQVQQYRNDPGPAAKARYQRAAAAGTNALLTLSHDGETNDWMFAQKELALLSRYHILAQQMFAASDVGDTTLLHQASQSGEPIATQLEQEMNTAASQHRQQALQNQSELRSVLLAALLATPVVIGGTLLLFSSCWLLLVTYHSRVERAVLTDALTHLPNHRALLECLEKETAGARRYGYPFSILFFDGDHFKRVNDTYGHSVGDAVLQELGRRGRESLRGGDTLGRYGGEEFMVLLPQTDVTQAGEVAERMRVAMAVSPLVPGLVPGGVPLTISIGVATFPVDGQTASEVVERADQAMYWAKRLGRNQIRTALEAQRASQDSALAATILNLERRDAPSLDGLDVEQTVRANQLSTIQSLMGLLDSRDQGISAHSYQVSDLAGAIARERGMDQKSVFAVSTAALLHDIGKIALPDLLLQKAGPLSSQEWELIRQHPALGAQILDVSPYLHHLMPAVHHHHENWDGTGYPDALAGEAIPLAARIIRVAEACSAMMSRRAYQAERSSSATCDELQRCTGRQFDPDIVHAVLTILGRMEHEAIAGREQPLASSR